MPVALDEVMDGGWAASMAPVAPDIGRMGDFLRAEIRAGRSYLPAGQQCPARVPAPARRRQGADRRPGPLSDAGPCRRPVVRRRPAGPPAAALAGQHLPRAGRGRRHRPAGARRPHRLVRPGRAAAQPGPHRRTGPAGLAPEQGLGAGHRGGDPGAGRRYQGGQAPLVAILWGKDAQSLRPLLDGVPVIASAHPSPMSADRGFFGSRPVLPGERAAGRSRAERRSTGRSDAVRRWASMGVTGVRLPPWRATAPGSAGTR